MFSSKATTNSIIRIQAQLRAANAKQNYQKHYQMNQLTDDQLTYAFTYVIGNDPKMPEELNQYTEPKDKIALIATSGFRCISLACQLGNATHIPKIIVIDNSLRVKAFWTGFLILMQRNQFSKTKERFYEWWPTFLEQTKNKVYIPQEPDHLKSLSGLTTKYLSQDISQYFEKLFQQYSYDYVRKVILHLTFIAQSWTDADTFIKIKNIFAQLDIKKVFAYPSNIVCCLDDKPSQIQLLKNIQLLSPILSIHTDTCFKLECDNGGRPENVFLITNQDPDFVYSQLFSLPHAKPSFKITPSGLEYPNMKVFSALDAHTHVTLASHPLIEKISKFTLLRPVNDFFPPHDQSFQTAAIESRESENESKKRKRTEEKELCSKRQKKR